MKKMIVTLALALGLLTPALAIAPSAVYADAFSSSNAKSQACSGITGNEASGNCVTSGKSINDIIRTIVNFLSALIGVVAVIMIMVAGLKYITASGDSSKVQSAKNTLTYAIVGIVIVALAQGISQFVLKQITKSGNGNIPKKPAVLVVHRLNP